MKRLVALAAVGLVAVAVYATVAPAGPRAVTPKQFAALSKKVTTLTKTVNTLKKNLNAVASCSLVQAYPVAQYGNPPDEGYVYGDPGGTQELVTALDVSLAADAQAWLLGTTAECAGVIDAKHKVASLQAHR